MRHVKGDNSVIRVITFRISSFYLSYGGIFLLGSYHDTFNNYLDISKFPEKIILII